jgi:hypothetical protein
MPMSCECCVLSGRSFCDELIIRPEESYRLWCVVCVWSINLKNEVIARVGPQRQKLINLEPEVRNFRRLCRYVQNFVEMDLLMRSR